MPQNVLIVVISISIFSMLGMLNNTHKTFDFFGDKIGGLLMISITIALTYFATSFTSLTRFPIVALIISALFVFLLLVLYVIKQKKNDEIDIDSFIIVYSIMIVCGLIVALMLRGQ